LVDTGALKTTLRVDLGNINAKNILQAHQLIGSGRMIGMVAMGKFD
jgi:hypothetical protein